MPEIPFAEVAYHDDYKRLKAIIGGGKLSQESWPEWARLQERYGWKLLIRAADRCEPLERWPANVEHVCRRLHEDEQRAQAEWLAKQYSPKREKMTREECEERAKIFSEIRRKVMP